MIRTMPALAALLMACALSAMSCNASAAMPSDADIVRSPAQAWTDFLALADLSKSYDAYDALQAVGYAAGQVNAAGCRKGAAALEAAVRAVPVSVVLQHARLACAEALDDEVAAERALDVLGALSRHGLAQASEGWMPKPIVVLHPSDAYALVRLGGFEPSYEYYGNLQDRRYLPLVVAAWDAEAGQERHLTFDYLDASYHIDRDPLAGYPIQREQLRAAFIKGQVEHDNPMGLDYRAVTAAALAADSKGKVDKLREAASGGGFLSMANWIVVCGKQPFDGCGDGLIDALLPHAEKQQALPMALLALAYDGGIGIDADPVAAGKLLDAADRRWRNAGASGVYAMYWALMHSKALPAALEARLSHARAQGNPQADFAAAFARTQVENAAFTQDDLAALAAPANNGTGIGFALLAAYYETKQDKAQADAWRARAAEAGEPNAQVAQGLSMLDPARKSDEARAKRLFGESAHGGNERGARMRSYFAQDDAQWREAEAWLLGAADSGYIESMLALALLYEGERPGVRGKAKEAADIYRRLVDNDDLPEARRRLAMMALEGRGTEKDPEQARKWLLKDAERGDHASETALGGALLRGELGDVDEPAGRRWMQRALDAKHEDAYTDFGYWLFFVKRTPESRAEAIALWRKGVALGLGGIDNNLAWGQCTAPDGMGFDAAAGLEAAERMRARGGLPPAELDTVAACQAAVGDYATAATTQQQGLDDLPPEDGEDDVFGAMRKNFRQRLALYRSGKRYVEVAPD